MSTLSSNVLDLRPIAPLQRHAQIFSLFETLQPGQTLELLNDHDPQALNAQFELRSPGQFSWTALEQGPDVWRVQVGKTAAKAASSCCGGCCGG